MGVGNEGKKSWGFLNGNSMMATTTVISGFSHLRHQTKPLVARLSEGSKIRGSMR